MPFHTRSPHGWFLLSLLVVLCAPGVAAAPEIDGVALDPDGRPTPRAHLLLTRAWAAA